MNPCLYAPKVLLAGLAASQLLATLQVHLSNADLYASLQRLDGAGYLTIPNRIVMQRLPDPGPAVWGGLFFALSVGAGLALLTLAGVWVWDRLFHRRSIAAVFGVLLWLGLAAASNHAGFAPLVAAHFLVIPVVVAVTGLKWRPSPSGSRPRLLRLIHALPVLLLAGLWLSQMDAHLFVGIRDNLLLSSRLGGKINDFYYRHTLYAAHVFKSLDQKTLNACTLEDGGGRPSDELAHALLENDYLPVESAPAVDVRIVQEGDRLAFQYEGRPVLAAAVEDFVSRPGELLKQYSSMADRYGFFRKFTFFSVLVGFPLALYVLFFGLFCLVLSVFLPARTSSVAASVLCLAAGVALFVVFSLGKAAPITAEALPGAMAAARWQTRVAALKTVCERRMEVARFQAVEQMLASPVVPERYWLARALGASRRPEAHRALLRLLKDPHPNVVCMALYALGQRGNRSAIPKILAHIEKSDHWYEQWYAYRALRKLGWKQTKST